MKRILFLVVCLTLSNSAFLSAQASCSTVPNKPSLTFVSELDGIEFTVSPSNTGCEATSLNFTYSYFDESARVWDKWSSWVVGSTSGKTFSFKVPSVRGKKSVAFAATASNKWGTSELSRENSVGNGIEFTIVANTTISALIQNKKFTFEISHPESGVCSNYLDSSYASNCSIPMKYRITSEDSTSTFYGNGEVYTEAGKDVGYFGGSTFIDAASPQWRSTSIYISMPATGKVYLFFTGAGNHHSYKTILQSTIFLTVKTAEQVAAEKAAAEKAAADKAAADIAAKAAEEKTAAEKAAAKLAAKKITINCVKGKVIKKVTGENPSCPSGYKNPLSGFLTFQAFSKCKLYKKDSILGGAKLLDSGRTLDLQILPNPEFLSGSVTYGDFECAKRILNMPDFVGVKIRSTRAIDGIQSAKWGKISSFWNYHPDDGLKITFNTK